MCFRLLLDSFLCQNCKQVEIITKERQLSHSPWIQMPVARFFELCYIEAINSKIILNTCLCKKGECLVRISLNKKCLQMCNKTASTLYCVGSTDAYFLSVSLRSIINSSNCFWSTREGASSITSRPELFLGKAIQSRMLSRPAKSETQRSRP